MTGSATGVELIAAERDRQVVEKGWTAEHDDKHSDGALALVAALYATPRRLYRISSKPMSITALNPWPWFDEEKRKKNRPRLQQLVVAGALIAAEIDRIQRRDKMAT